MRDRCHRHLDNMQKAKTKANFYPYQRYENAMRRFLKKEKSSSGDIWEDKILDILAVREKFKDEYKDGYLRFFEAKYPLYASLITAFEDDKTGGDRDTLESILLTSLDLTKVSDELKHPRFTELFLSLYRTLFYDVTKVLGNPSLEFQYLIAPILKMNSDKLAVGAVWKVLALTGGISLLKRKGFGNSPIKAEDIEYLLQLASYRHCSNLLQYTTSGRAFFEENPAAALAINALTNFDGVRGSGRRPDYLAELSSVAKNNFNSLLNSELKLISLPDSEIIKLVEYDGRFSPELDNSIEYTKHVTFIDSETNDDE